MEADQIRQIDAPAAPPARLTPEAFVKRVLLLPRYRALEINRGRDFADLAAEAASGEAWKRGHPMETCESCGTAIGAGGKVTICFGVDRLGRPLRDCQLFSVWLCHDCVRKATPGLRAAAVGRVPQ